MRSRRRWVKKICWHHIWKPLGTDVDVIKQVVRKVTTTWLEIGTSFPAQKQLSIVFTGRESSGDRSRSYLRKIECAHCLLTKSRVKIPMSHGNQGHSSTQMTLRFPIINMGTLNYKGKIKIEKLWTPLYFKCIFFHCNLGVPIHFWIHRVLLCIFFSWDTGGSLP